MKPQEVSVTGGLGHWREAGVVGVLCAAVVAASLIFQRQIAVNGGRGWDGNFYYLMAEQAGSGQQIITDAPFVYRLFVPLAAATGSPGDVMLGFKIVNAVAIAVTIVLMVIWLRLHLTSWLVRVVVMGLFVTQWVGPLRTYFWYPVLVDYWLFPAVLAGLLIIERLRSGGRRTVWLPVLCLISLFAVTIREAGLLIPLAVLFAYNPISGPLMRLRERARDLLAIPRSLAIPVLVGGATLVAIRLIVVATGSYSFLVAAGHWLLTVGPDAYALAWLIAFGPVLMLPIFYWRACARFLRDHQALALFLVAVAGVSWIGGNDNERFLFWGAPIVYVLIGISIEELVGERCKAWFIAVLTITQIVSARLLWVLPAVAVDSDQVSEIILLTPIGTDISIYDVTASDAASGVRLTLDLEYLVVAILLLGALFSMRRLKRAIARRKRPARPLPTSR